MESRGASKSGICVLVSASLGLLSASARSQTATDLPTAALEQRLDQLGGLVPGRLTIDRSVVRFTAPETGGLQNPRFISERLLAFEARLEALADANAPEDGVRYRPRHVRRAMERHIAETLLSTLEIDPPVSSDKLAVQALAARANLAQRVGGMALLRAAAKAEAISDAELEALFQRQAKASLYLDRMITPMLDPSEAELRVIHRTVRTPFMRDRFDLIHGKLRRWYISQSLSEALRNYYEGARNRVAVTLLTD